MALRDPGRLSHRVVPALCAALVGVAALGGWLALRSQARLGVAVGAVTTPATIPCETVPDPSTISYNNTGITTVVPAPTAPPLNPAKATILAASATPARPKANPAAKPATPVAGPDQSVTSQTERDGLILQLRLPKARYLAGESGQAEVSLRNVGANTYRWSGEPYFAHLMLLDEQGRWPIPWPWLVGRPGLPFGSEIGPGHLLGGTLEFLVPFAEQAAGHAYGLWVMMSIAGPVSDQDRSFVFSDALKAGPIPLTVVPPTPAQRLTAQLRYNAECWQVRASAADGRVPPGPLRGELEADGVGVGLVATLWPSDRGVWSGRWDLHAPQGGGPNKVRIWVGAPGYVTAMVSQAADGSPAAWP